MKQKTPFTFYLLGTCQRRPFVDGTSDNLASFWDAMSNALAKALKIASVLW